MSGHRTVGLKIHPSALGICFMSVCAGIHDHVEYMMVDDRRTLCADRSSLAWRGEVNAHFWFPTSRINLTLTQAISCYYCGHPPHHSSRQREYHHLRFTPTQQPPTLYLPSIRQFEPTPKEKYRLSCHSRGIEYQPHRTSTGGGTRSQCPAWERLGYHSFFLLFSLLFPSFFITCVLHRSGTS
ncbi:hypothetical protein P167DRAFT_218218 [Morchella conica CCBAS932]|uniref:Uncharacterized protein n=1 Tax=Morchella conica CCBAS932 TaxID=1392247 RepID=A0A3N4KLU6_9PEZI|nr:hypothetical protein P167DRAFT_218218 [Morchella conica CCBAS932]